MSPNMAGELGFIAALQANGFNRVAATRTSPEAILALALDL